MLEGGTIVVGTDLSERAALAVAQASRWAALTNSRLVAVFVVANPLRGNPLFPSWDQHVLSNLRSLERRAREELQRQLEASATGLDPAQVEVVLERRAREELQRQLTANGAGLDPASVEVVLEQGDPATVLAAQARSRSAGLLVVGSHGYTGIKRALLGSVAEKVVRRAECPVLVARDSPGSGPVLIGTDFSEPSRVATAWGLEAARRLELKPLLAHVVDYGPLPSVAWSASFPEPMAAGFGSATYLPPPEIREEARRDAERRLKSELFGAGVDGEVTVEEGPAGPTLASLAETRGAALVVVGTAGRTGLARLALGSVAESVVRHSRCSVLVVRSGAPD